MIFTRSLSIFFSLSLGVYITFTKATTFDVVNQCPYTVWVAASPLGGRQLNTGDSWSLTVNPSTKISRIWGRTNCSVDDDGRTKCQTGDCSGLLQCQNLGSPPLTLAEISLNRSLNLDFMDISLVNGFNIPMELGPATNVCRAIKCSADINGQCPEDLQTSGGCYSACHVFKTNEFCCEKESCGPTEYSRFFKKRCPNALTYPYDDAKSSFTCPAGTNYTVVFCPSKMGIEVHGHATFEVRNECPYTVWAAAMPGGGMQLDSGQSWTFNVIAGTIGARIWARTNCNFDGAGHGLCETGDCGGLLACQAYGAPPNTLAEYALNQFNNLDFFDISLMDGFNVPMDFSPTSNECSRGIKCAADINGQCPAQLKAPGGCNNPCTVFKTDQYCCNSGSCGATNYSRFFKTRCPDAYSYPKDDQTALLRALMGLTIGLCFVLEALLASSCFPL